MHALLQVKGYIIPLIVHALQLIALHALFFPVQLFDVSVVWLLPHLGGEEILARTATVFPSPSSSVQHPVLTQVDACGGAYSSCMVLQIWKINNLTHKGQHVFSTYIFWPCIVLILNGLCL